MTRSLTFTILLIVSCFAAFGQTPSYAPIQWQRYLIASQKISIEFPKLPVVLARPNACTETEKSSYFAYAGEAVYELTISSKPKPMPGCKVARKFGEALLVERLSQIRQKSGLAEATGVEDGRQVFRYSGDSEIRIVYADWKQNRWVEAAVVHRNDVNTDESKFLTSLKLGSEDGQEIGPGAESVIGDEGVDLSPAPDTVKDANRDRVQVIAKQMAMYTEKARAARTQGMVSLRVEFLANGGIGEITVLKGLDNGLTDNALAAAKKTVFLPARSGGKPATTKLTIQYGFNIY